jgi:transcriptional regulator with XRE-family HTH domain
MEGELQRTVGRNLRAYRRHRGLSQEALADVLGVHRTYMGGIERGERNLTLKSLERIADRIGVDPLALLGAAAAAGDGADALAVPRGPGG